MGLIMMRRTIVNKLRSQSGASISFALLLFLVCAVVCSIVLTAATASTGRLSNMAEVDQRYYCVTSACEWLKAAVDGTSASIVKVEKIPLDDSGEEKVDAVEVLGTYILDKPADQVSEDDFVDENKLLETNHDSIQRNAVYNFYQRTADMTYPIPRSLKLSITGISDALVGMLNVNVKEEITFKETDGTTDKSATIFFTCSNEDDKRIYAIKMKFMADINETSGYKRIMEKNGVEIVVEEDTSEPMEDPISEPASEPTSEETGDPAGEPITEAINYYNIKTTITSLTWKYLGIANDTPVGA